VRLTRRIRRDWAFAASLLAHMAVIGTVFARFAPAPVPPPPVKMEIRIAPIVTQTVAATPPPEQVVKAEPPPPIRAVEPEPEVIKSKAPEAPVVAKAPPKRPKPVPAIKPPPPRPVAIQPVRQAKVVPQPDPSPPAAPRVTAPPQDYLSRISAKLQRCKDYPRSARLRHIEGDVTLWFVIDRSGRVVDYRIARSSGHEILDEAVDAMIKKASPFPPMPDSMTQARLEITQPVTFRLR
jgi:protein TonB